MNYPHFPNKHLLTSAFSPEDSLDKQKFRKNFPKKWIIVYPAPWMRRHLIKRYRVKDMGFKAISDLFIFGKIGFIIMRGIGSPHAAATLEEVIARGGKEFINVGTAGGLQSGGFYLCKKALRDEGTSHHYIKFGKFIEPNLVLTNKLKKTLKKKKFPFREGTTWTIDSYYRESHEEIKKYSKEGISTVEMEASALFAVGKFRGVKVASIFVVSDLPMTRSDKEERFKFSRSQTKKNYIELLDVAVDCLKEK